MNDKSAPLPESDHIEGLPPPRAWPHLFGQEEAEAALIHAYSRGRAHHAWLLTGPGGVGKATLAYRIARMLFAHGGQIPEGTENLDMDPGHPLFGQVARLAHPDLFVVRRMWDEKAKRLQTRISADTVRQLGGFFSKSSGSGGFRIAVIDKVDDLTNHAANSLLKVLEEPPDRSLLILVCDRPGAILPTIRSRCLKLPLMSLAPEPFARTLDLLCREGYLEAPDGGDWNRLHQLAQGSPGRAAELLFTGGRDLAGDLGRLLDNLRRQNDRDLHGFIGRFGRARNDHNWDLFRDFLTASVHADITSLVGPETGGMGSPIDAWLDYYDYMQEVFDRTAAVNLDYGHAALALLTRYKQTARATGAAAKTN